MVQSYFSLPCLFWVSAYSRINFVYFAFEQYENVQIQLPLTKPTHFPDYSGSSKRSLLECFVTYLLVVNLRLVRDVLSTALHSESSNLQAAVNHANLFKML